MTTVTANTMTTVNVNANPDVEAAALVSALEWKDKLDFMGLFAERAVLQEMLDCAPTHISIKDDVEALTKWLSELN